MSRRRPGCAVLVGNGSGEQGGAGACRVHKPGCDFNDHNIAIGSAYWVLLTDRFLAAKEPATT